ncbi:MAG: phosphomannomutase [Acidobacteria bacterium]|nr:MAG: phosphomannomutase [Acidobacteriota bacterium]
MTMFRGRKPAALAFGTSGLRGLVTDITDLEAYINTRGFLDYVKARDGKVSVAGDLRPSTDRILCAVATAIEDAGCVVEYLGKIPTPALALHGIGHRRPHVMVTGSHIPFDRNGIKFGKPAGEVLKDDEGGILDVVSKVREVEYGRSAAASRFADDGRLKEPIALPAVNDRGAAAYIERYVNFFPASGLSGKRVVVFEHSAVGRALLVEILTRLGAAVVPTRRSDAFIPIDTEDITAERLAELQEMADDEHGADAIVSTDGDSDRPLVAGIDPEGRVRFFCGDLLGIIVAKYLGADTFCVPVSTNDAVDLELGNVTKTRIGSPYVVQAMIEARGENIVGWEANGGFLTGSEIEKNGRHLSPLPTRDAVLPILCALYASAERGRSLVELFSELPPRYSKAGLLDDFARDKSLEILRRFEPGDFPAIRKELRSYFTRELGFDDIVNIDTTDGLRLYFANGDIAHIRPSGNAPQLRIYAVANTEARAEAIVKHALSEPNGILRRLS